MPVYKLSEEMPHDEYLKWFAYFNKRPLGWREDQRIYRILQAMGIKAKPDAIFETLAQLKTAHDEAILANQTDMRNFKRSVLFKALSQGNGFVPDFMKG
jgi:hypothetical protein